MRSNPEKYAHFIKQTAYELGFLTCGVAKADFLEEEAPRLESWLNKNAHGEMTYMANHFDKRLDPRLLVEGAKSVVSLTYNYFTDQLPFDNDRPKISKYAFGEDYHTVIKDKLKTLLDRINQEIGEVNGRCFIDSAPVLDKAWANRAGLGWIGKNSNLIAKQQGSFFFLAELIIDLELKYDTPFVSDHCGSCTKCIDACPTEAIIAPYQVDGSKCISYLTIELKNEIPIDFKGKMDNWVFGCDVCQDVCPWNRFSVQHQEPRFNPNEEFLSIKKKELEEITSEVFTRVFKNSAIKRTKYAGLKRNLEFIKKL